MLSVSNRTGSLIRAWSSKLVVLKWKMNIEFKFMIFAHWTGRCEGKKRPDSDIDGTVLSTYRLQIHNYGQQQIRLTKLARVQWKFKTWEVHISCWDFESMPSGFACLYFVCQGEKKSVKIRESWKAEIKPLFVFTSSQCREGRQRSLHSQCGHQNKWKGIISKDF